MQKILILDSELSMCEKLSSFLRNNGFITASTHNHTEALQLLKATAFDIILCDCLLKNTYAVDFLQKIKLTCPQIPIISISEQNDIQTAVELMKHGAFYFMLKPLNPEKLLSVISAALAEQKTQPATATTATAKQEAAPAKPVTGYSYIKGESNISRRLYKEIGLVAPTDYTVIIHGETGTGKESVARLIHESSARAGKPFVAVDCGSLSKELAASELFGHEKGAFTGALQTKEGAFGMADGGTLFLDEIGNLSYSVQLYLLRAIQERIIRKVGSALEKPVNVRLIVASNEDLDYCVMQKKFREDLYHRLNEFTISVPALRDRKEDLGLFVNTFIAEAACRLNKEIKGIDEKAMEILCNYQWPGNIRELINTVKKACLVTPDGEYIRETNLPYEILSPLRKEMPEPDTAAVPEPEEKTNHSFNLKEVASHAELHKIMSILKRVHFNKSKAAAILNIDRKTLYNKLKKINM